MLYADADDENDYEEVVEEILDFLEEHKNDVFPDAVFPTNRGRMGSTRREEVPQDAFQRTRTTCLGVYGTLLTIDGLFPVP